MGFSVVVDMVVLAVLWFWRGGRLVVLSFVFKSADDVVLIREVLVFLFLLVDVNWARFVYSLLRASAVLCCMEFGGGAKLEVERGPFKSAAP